MPRINDEYISDGGGGFRPVAKGFGTHFFDGQTIVAKPKKKLTKKQQKIAEELQEEERQERERKMWDAYMERDDREEYYE